MHKNVLEKIRSERDNLPSDHAVYYKGRIFKKKLAFYFITFMMLLFAIDALSEAIQLYQAQ